MMTESGTNFTSNGGMSTSPTTTTSAEAASSSSLQHQHQHHHPYSSGMSQWSPVSTLERQYRCDTANKNQMLLLFVKTNANCCLAGGVEYILKQSKSSAAAAGSSTSTSISISTSGTSLSALEAELQNGNGGDFMTAASSTSASASSVGAGASASTDPFSFLNESATTEGNVTASNNNNNSINSNSNTTTKKGPNIGRFLKKVAKSTTATLERSMHNLAIRADQGRNRDLLAVGLYDAQHQLLSLTESRALPADETERFQGLTFAIPLTLSTTTTTSTSTPTATAAASPAVHYYIKLWIRSGAALLQQTKAAKNYLIGAATLTMPQLEYAIRQQHAGFQGAILNVSLQSSLVVDGRLQLLVTNDRKFPALCGRGWALPDPDPRSAYTQHHYGLYNLSLHQAYALSSHLPRSATLVATERTVESTVVLPIAAAMARLAAAASHISLQHAQSTLLRVSASRHDKAVGEHALCQIMVGALLLDNVDFVVANCHSCATMAASSASYQQQLLSPILPVCHTLFQRPDSIFEVELVAPTSLPLQQQQQGQTTAAAALTPFTASTSCSFFPKPCRHNILPGLLQTTTTATTTTTGGIFMLGSIRLQITVPAGFPAPVAENPFGGAATTTAAAAAVMSPTPQVWECIVPLDPFLSSSQSQNVPLEFPVMNAAGQVVAKVSCVVSLTMEHPGQVVPVEATSASGGLVSLMGLPPLVEDILPPMDYCSSSSDATQQQQQQHDPGARRRQQLATMGFFVTHAYMEQHIQTTRSVDAKNWHERAQRYWGALQQGAAVATTTAMNEQRPKANEDRTPKAFRPSSSRSDVMLAGIPFNVHTASLSLDVLDPEAAPTVAAVVRVDPPIGATFQNITCGAPADHASGYGSIFPKKDPNGQYTGLMSPIGPVEGGLRRLEEKRAELASVLSNMEMVFTMSIANYFMGRRQQVKSRANIHHVPPSTAELSDLRRKMFEAYQSLHHVTWACAMRRSVVFSQALGIAASSFLASLSDPARWQSSWPDLWMRHGFLVSFEGLLSAAGKELGMIQDASVGISMLKMVKIVIVPDVGGSSILPEGSVPVPNSPYLKWIILRPSGTSPEVEFTLQIGVVQSYYDQRIPNALKNGASVRFYPLLFEVGVDIRQWGAHARSNLQQGTASKAAAAPEKPEPPTGGLLEEEDDDVGIPDDDVLVQLNSEAFQKLNAYAHAISPVPEKQKTHPMLATLYQHIVSSAGKINHDIVDEAATLAQQLGGGGVVFCKSGKDRTAMHVTYKQAQFANRFRQHLQLPESTIAAADTTIIDGNGIVAVLDTTLADATLMRVHGTRLPICEKNVGQAKYAFNSLQVKFMPDALKPPMHTLAGFLKGGKVFSGGAIES